MCAESHPFDPIAHARIARRGSGRKHHTVGGNPVFTKPIRERDFARNDTLNLTVAGTFFVLPGAVRFPNSPIRAERPQTGRGHVRSPPHGTGTAGFEDAGRRPLRWPTARSWPAKCVRGWSIAL